MPLFNAVSMIDALESMELKFVVFICSSCLVDVDRSSFKYGVGVDCYM